MKARDAISRIHGEGEEMPSAVISGEMPLLEVLPRLLEAPGRRLGVEDAGVVAGVIDSDSLLESLGHQISARYDSNVLEIECAAADYSASRISHAVEDADVHLVDLLSVPADEGRVHVTLRVRCENPEPVAHSLERYGYRVVSMSGNPGVAESLAYERLLELQTLINV